MTGAMNLVERLAAREAIEALERKIEDYEIASKLLMRELLEDEEDKDGADGAIYLAARLLDHSVELRGAFTEVALPFRKGDAA